MHHGPSRTPASYKDSIGHSLWWCCSREVVCGLKQHFGGRVVNGLFLENFPTPTNLDPCCRLALDVSVDRMFADAALESKGIPPPSRQQVGLQTPRIHDHFDTKPILLILLTLTSSSEFLSECKIDPSESGGAIAQASAVAQAAACSLRRGGSGPRAQWGLGLIHDLLAVRNRNLICCQHWFPYLKSRSPYIR